MTTILPNVPVSPLRQKLIDDMTMRHFSAATQRNYIRDVGRFASFLRRSPDTATIEDVRQFQLAQSEAGVPVPTMNTVVSALRFFFANTLDRPDLARKLVRVSHPRNLPVVLSRDEVARLLNATTSLKHQAALSVAYGAGLRVGEVAMLKVRDIDSERMLIRVERGKGGRYRNAMLSPDLLTLLHQWWQHGHRKGVLHRDGWLFFWPVRPQADQHQAALTRRGQGGSRRRDYQARRSTHIAAQLRHAFAGRRRRCPHHPGAARPCQARDDCALYQGGNAHGACHYQSARQARHLRSDRGATRPLSGALHNRGRRYFPDCRPGLSRGPCQASEPRPTQGHVGDRKLSHRCPWWSCGSLFRLRASTDRLQLMPQPALPAMPGRRCTRLARSTGSQSPAGRLLPRRLHPARRDRRHCLP